MARDQRKSDARGIGTRPEGIRKHRPQRATRRSARLEGIQLLQKQPGSPNQRAPRHPFPSPSTSNTRTKESSQAGLKVTHSSQNRTRPRRLDREGAGAHVNKNPQREYSVDNCQSIQCSQDLPISGKPSDPAQRLNQKRKRSQLIEDPIPQTQDEPTEYQAEESVQKRQRTSCAANYTSIQGTSHDIDNGEDGVPDSSAPDQAFNQEAYPRLLTRPQQQASHASSVKNISNQEVARNIDNNIVRVRHWAQKGSWPKEYFEQDNQTQKDLGKYICLEDYLIEQDFIMAHILARQKSSSSLPNNPESITPTPSEQQSRGAKSSKYRTAAYETVLATKGSFMGKSKLGVSDECKRLFATLLDAKQTVPPDTLFREDLFDETCENVRARNEAMIIRDISPLICPSVQSLRIYGANKNLKHLIESVNEGWNSAIPFYGPRPQPDYSVGFRRSAFTDEKWRKLLPFVGEIEDTCTSYFMATWQIYFPFFTCEVKCGAKALDVADRQNAHSMTLAVRGVVELFKYVKREKELDRDILAFSISHDHSSVRIYGHYAVIEANKTTFYRHSIKEFSFTSEEGKDKWTTYKFTKNIYDLWMPNHLKRLCSAINDLPANVDFDVSPDDPLTSNVCTDRESDILASEEVATSAPSSSFKKPRLRPTVMLQQEIERQRQENAELKEQLKQDREQSKQENAELKEQIKGLMDMMRQKMN